MPLLDIAILKQQLKIEADDTSEDELLTLYLSSAEAAVARMLGQKIYKTTADIDPLVTYALSLDEHPDVTLAILLLASHYHAHREAVSETSLTEIPMGVQALLGNLVIYFPEL